MSHSPSSQPPTGSYLAGLSLAALGVVYGDLGTSPLYTLKEVFSEHYGLAANAPNVLGVLSLIFWSLILVISVKYITFVMRADLKGEGGIMVLTALVTPFRAAAPGGARVPELAPPPPHDRHGESREHAVRRVSRRRRLLILLGLFGAALLYGDGMITPAITVLSAIEGLSVATDFFAHPGRAPLIPLITVVILVALFVAQKRGTAGLGKVFGPVMLAWFALIGALGLYHIVLAPEVFAAVNPLYGVRFFLHNGSHAFWILGSVVLALTGGEALYADMGHFGVRPIRLAWYTVVLPGLLLCYFGQGAMLLTDSSATSDPFFRLVPGPEWAVYPVVVMATLAAIIASQAIISGAFSLTRQAVQLGYLPRMKILQTSSREIGQIYVPSINWMLLAACVGLVIGFGSSNNLAAAYGVAVTTTMAVTTLLFYVVARRVWGWSLWTAGSLSALFLVIDLSFLGANLIKIPHGGWFPLVVAALMFSVMTTWEAGRGVMARRMRDAALPLSMFLEDKGVDTLARVPGTAIFMGGNPQTTPPALLHTVKHIKALHETVVVLTVRTEEVPHVAPEDRLTIEPLPHGFYRAVIAFGFIDEPDVPGVLATARVPGLSFAPMETTYFVGRERIISTRRPSGMARWRERLYSVLSNNARSATAFFDIPANRVVEMGAQIEI